MLVGGGEVGGAALRLLGPRSRVAYSSAVFSPAKEKSRPPTLAAVGNSKAAGSPSRGQLRQRRPARVAEAEQPRALVERLAGGVVERAAEPLEAAVLGHAGQQRVAAGGEQAQERRLDRVRLQVVGGHVAVQVVDRRQREPARGGEGLGGGDADEQRADQARALGDGDQLDVVERGARAGERVVDDGVDQLQVMARGDLGHHAAVAVVDRPARRRRWSAPRRRRDDRRAGVVAGRLEREDHSGSAASGTSSSRAASVAGVRHMTIASSPLSA